MDLFTHADLKSLLADHADDGDDGIPGRALRELVAEGVKHRHGTGFW